MPKAFYGFLFGLLLGLVWGVYLERPLPNQEWNSARRTDIRRQADAYHDSILANPEPRP